VRAKQLEDYLHGHIPLSRAMAVRVAQADDDCVVLEAPLAPNINHHATVFGGSASALAILAGWSLLHTRLSAHGPHAQLVIQRNSVEYERPLTGAFSARATFTAASDWDSFVALLRRRGRSRITVPAVLLSQGLEAGRFSGQFVALADGAGP